MTETQGAELLRDLIYGTRIALFVLPSEAGLLQLNVDIESVCVIKFDTSRSSRARLRSFQSCFQVLYPVDKVFHSSIRVEDATCNVAFMLRIAAFPAPG